MRYQMTHQIHLACASFFFFSLLSMGMGYSKHNRLRMLTKAHFSRLTSPNNLAHGQSGSDLGSALILRGVSVHIYPFPNLWLDLHRYTPCHFCCGTVASHCTHLHLPLGQQLLPGPLANVIRVTGLEGYSGHGSLT